MINVTEEEEEEDEDEDEECQSGLEQDSPRQWRGVDTEVTKLESRV